MTLPSAIYVWLVPSEHMLDQPGSWRIRKWDTEPFPEANFVAGAGSFNRGLHAAKVACMGQIIGTAPHDHATDRAYDRAVEDCVRAIAKLEEPPATERNGA